MGINVCLCFVSQGEFQTQVLVLAILYFKDIAQMSVVL